MKEPVVEKIAIIGVGLIGGSIGMAAKARGLAKKVIGIGRDPKKLHRAQELAAIDIWTTDLMAGAADADIIFICTPVLAVVPMVKAISLVAKEGAIITDVGSTKAEITRGAEEAVPPGVTFIGGHPMAGLETGGVESALPYLFLDATYVITPTRATSVTALNTLVQFAQGLGSHVVLMNPEEHDRSAAVVSHLPHILSASLLRLASEEQARSGKVLELAAGSFRDMTRVSSSPTDVWVDICMSNRETISRTIDQMVDILQDAREKIMAGDANAIEKIFSKARDVRTAWIKDSEK
jgi:prephenate dehydrogenase